MSGPGVRRVNPDDSLRAPPPTLGIFLIAALAAEFSDDPAQRHSARAVGTGKTRRNARTRAERPARSADAL